MLVLPSRHQAGVPILLLIKAGRKCPRAAPLGCHQTTAGGCSCAPVRVGVGVWHVQTHPPASSGPSAGTGSSMHTRAPHRSYTLTQSSAQPSPAELAQLAWASPRAVEPKPELRLACSQTLAIAEVCPMRHRAESCTWISSLPFLGSTFPAPEVLH